MSKSIDSSNYLSALDYAVQFNMATGTISVTLQGTIWKTGGALAVAGASLICISPSGSVLVDGSTLNFPAPMDNTRAFVFALPKVAGIYEFGIYQFRLALYETAFSAASVSYSLDKLFNLCSPYSNRDNNGQATLRLEADCEHGILRVYGGSGYAYKGKDGASWDMHYMLNYPTASGVPSVPFDASPAQFSLYTGSSRITGYADGTFAFDDQFTVVVRFLADTEKYVQCNFPCHLWCAYEALVNEVAAKEEGTRDYERLYEKLGQVQVYMPLVLLGLRCQKNVDPYLEILEEILGTENCPCADEEVVLVGPAMAAPALHSGLPPIVEAVPTTTTVAFINSGIGAPVDLKIMGIPRTIAAEGTLVWPVGPTDTFVISSTGTYTVEYYKVWPPPSPFDETKKDLTGVTSPLLKEESGAGTHDLSDVWGVVTVVRISSKYYNDDPATPPPPPVEVCSAITEIQATIQ